MRILPDTSVVIDGRISDRIAAGDYTGATVIVPEAVVAELERQANDGIDSGWNGLAELKRLAELASDGAISLEYVGDRPTQSDVDRAGEGEIDAIIRELAVEHDAHFVTSDIVQREVAEAKGIDVEYIAPAIPDVGTLDIEGYFDEVTMSVHLKAGVPPMAKRGAVGEMAFERIGDEILPETEIEEIAREIESGAKQSSEGFIELSEPGMRIVQFRDYRIAIARPPFSDAIEITAVRPLVKTVLDDYRLADGLRDRFLARQRGVLIAGSPGAGKSTFAQAVASFLSESGYAVKTMEKPRDLQVGPEITQYTELAGSMEKTADALLLVRPDYTVYDEVRKTSDFRVFADMRMAGVGMVGVVHASRAIDALQRLIGRVELGMIPQVVDTVVFIEAGEVHTVYNVSTEVKVPHGLTEEDLARPVIVIRDYESGRPEYEIYTFNRQIVTVKLTDQRQSESGVTRIARQEIEREIRSIARGHVEVELQNQNRAIVYVDDRDISSVIGKGGGRIDEIERRLGISIDVRTHDERSSPNSSQPEFTESTGDTVIPDITSRHIRIDLGDSRAGETVEVRANNEYLFTATVGRAGDIQVSRGSQIARELEDAIDRRKTITVAST